MTPTLCGAGLSQMKLSAPTPLALHCFSGLVISRRGVAGLDLPIMYPSLRGCFRVFPALGHGTCSGANPQKVCVRSFIRLFSGSLGGGGIQLYMERQTCEKGRKRKAY